MVIKGLPEHFADDAERLKRFEREATTLASLNHPNVAQIFERFFTTKDVSEGTGLGLAIARELMRVQGGDIRLARNEATGATFVLELPDRDAA